MTRPKATRQADDIIGLLDVGTAKTVCLVVAVPRPRAGAGPRREDVQVLGVGHKPSRGLKAGVVVELDEAEGAVRAAVMAAEQAAGVTLEDVFLAVACGQLKSSTFEADTTIEGRMVGKADIDRLTGAGRKYAERDGRTLLHMNHIAYRLDGVAGVRDPRGMAGSKLAADLHAVTADDAPLRNLLHVVERAYLGTAGFAPAPYASGLAATTPEERQLGVVCVDMGAGATTLSIFAEGHLLSVDAIPVGGNHVSFDIARSLATPFDQAERIKTSCGTLQEATGDDHEVVSYTLAGEEEPTLYQATKAHVRDIVRGRLAGLFGHVAERIERSGVARYAAHRTVLTGGGSQLPGAGEFAAQRLARPVRIARMQPLSGMPPDCCSPAFSTAIGLIEVALDPTAGVRTDRDGGVPETVGYLGRVKWWLKESF